MPLPDNRVAAKIRLDPETHYLLRRLALERGTTYNALITEMAERVIREARERGELPSDKAR